MMLTLTQTLTDYPVSLLRAIADARGLQSLVHAATPAALAVELSAALADPGSIVDAVERLPETAQTLLAALVQAGGAMTAPSFARLAGEVRQGGPAWLAREQPWLAPINAAEVLWYQGLIGRAFATVGGETGDFIFVPVDVLAWLPSASVTTGASLQLPLAPAPGTVHLSSYRLALDAGTLLAFVQNNEVMQDPTGRWRAADLAALNQQLLAPLPEALLAGATGAAGAADGGDRLSLLLTLGQALGWWRTHGGRLRLLATPARSWLQAPAPDQAHALWQAWLASTEWDDLRRVPDLRCEGSGWRNDAVATRRRLLVHLATIRPGVWHRREDLVAAIRRHDPDFQRSDGIYTTWYIRRSHESTYLLGFEHWDEVEGALLRFLIAGPLHWLGALDIGASGHGETAGEHGPMDTLRVTSQGAAWLAGQPQRVNAPPPAPIRVEADFNVHVPHSAAAFDRFRVARCTQWEASQPDFRYRITQTALRRAAAGGITAGRVLAFLRAVTQGHVPANVARALENLES